MQEYDNAGLLIMNREDTTLLEETKKLAKGSLENAEQLYKKVKQVKVIKMADMLGVERYSADERTHDTVFEGSKFPLKRLSDVSIGVRALDEDEGVRASGEQDVEVELPVIEPEHVKTLRFNDDDAQRANVTEKVFNEHGLKGGDIVMAVSGPLAGTSAIVPIFHGGALAGKGCLGLRPLTGECESFYLLNVLHFLYNTGLLTGEDIPVDTLLQVQIPVPPPNLQDEIAGVMLSLSGVMVAQEAAMAEAWKLLSMIEGS